MLNEKQKERYSRQLLSERIGEEGQEKLGQTKVLQIGAGGLGSPFASYITAAGIGELTIIDNDEVSLSNLQRQILYNEHDIGQVKVEIAKEKLTALNSNVKIHTHKEYVDDKSIQKYLEDIDFIVDCSDNMATKFLVNRVAVKHNIHCVIAGIKDFYGQIMTVDPQSSACYECVYSEQEGEEPRKTPLPVLGGTAGILGSLEAVEVIKTVLGLPNLENQLLMVDLLNMSFDKIQVVKNEKCLCAKFSENI